MKSLAKILFAAAISAVICLTTSTVSAQTVLAGWDVSGLLNSGPSPFAPTASNPNLTIGGLTKGVGVTNTGTGSVWGGNSWTNFNTPDSEIQAINGGKYATFTLTPNPGFTLSITNISKFFVSKSGTGPASGELQYSTNGTTFVDITSLAYGVQGTSISTTSIGTFSLLGVPALQNIPSNITATIRIVNWGATGVAGTWYLGNGNGSGSDFELQGTVVSGGVAPHITGITPSSITANASQTVQFTVSATGDPATNLWYQIIGATPTLIPSATSNTLTLPNVLGTNSGSYFVILTNLSGSDTSSVVTLSVVDPIFEIEPSSAQGLVGGQVQFGVTVAGTQPLSYSWYFSDTNGDLIAPATTLGDGSVISGAATNVLTVSKLKPNDLTNFVCVVTNTYGAITSSVASILAGSSLQGSLNNSTTLLLNNGMLAFWDFDGIQFTNTLVNPTCWLFPTPFIGSGTALTVGSCNNPGVSPVFVNPFSPYGNTTSALDPNDVGFDPNQDAYVFTPYGFEQPSPNLGWGTQNYPALVGTNKQNGVQFNVSTVGARNIRVAYDSRVSSTGSEYERLQYTTNGTDWSDYPASSTFSGLSGSGNSGYFPFAYSLAGFPGVDNNSNFAVRIMTEFQTTATYGVGTTNFWVGAANNYSANPLSNAAAGTVSYDLVAIYGDAINGDTNVAPAISFVNLPLTNGFAGSNGFYNNYYTNMVDTNTITVAFSASSPQMAASNLTFTVQPVDMIAAGSFTRAVQPSFSVSNTGSTNFLLNISFAPNNFIPDSIDASPIMVTATDTNGESTAAWFDLTVFSINQPPTNTLTALSGTNTLANVPVTIPFFAGSGNNAYSNLTYAVSSDNNTVVPNANIVVGGNTNTGNLTLTITPAANQVGNALIKVTVLDNFTQEPRSTTANIAFTVRPNTNVVAIDYFNYDAGGALDAVAANYWKHLSGAAGQLPVSGGVATISAGNSENLQAQLLGSPYATNSGKVLYASLVVNMTGVQLPTTNGSYFIAFNDGSGITSDTEDLLVAATNGAAPGFYRLGIANVNGADATEAHMFSQDLAPGINYFVVTSLALSNGFSTLWVSPTNQSSHSVTDDTPPNSPTNLYNIVNFELRESGATEGQIAVGNVTVGTTFNSVFYPPLANPDTYTVNENSVSNQLNAVQNDGGSGLTLTSVSETDGNGTNAISGNNVVFTPTSGFTGAATINYTVTDDVGNTSSSAITVNVTSAPSLVSPKISSISFGGPGNTNIVITGTNNNGTTAGNYAVLVSTNINLPLSNWTSLITQSYNPDGTLSYTNAPTTDPRRFFILQALP